MQIKTIDLRRHIVRGTFLLVLLVLFSSFTMTAYADHPRDNSAYQVSAVLSKATEVLVIMQDSVETEYDYTKKEEDTEYYDYTKKKEYTEQVDYSKKGEYVEQPEYKKTTVSSSADLEQLLEQIKQLQALIMILLELQRATLEQTVE
jgi:hypothetical protein